MEDFINKIKPEVETILIGLLLAVADALILLVSDGKAIDIAAVTTAAGFAAAGYLTSYYRNLRAKALQEQLNIKNKTDI